MPHKHNVQFAVVLGKTFGLGRAAPLNSLTLEITQILSYLGREKFNIVDSIIKL